MKSKLHNRSDLVEVTCRDYDDHHEYDGLIGVVMEVEDFGHDSGCWVMFPNASDLYERTRWHWIEYHRLSAVGKA